MIIRKHVLSNCKDMSIRVKSCFPFVWTHFSVTTVKCIDKKELGNQVCTIFDRQKQETNSMDACIQYNCPYRLSNNVPTHHPKPVDSFTRCSCVI